MLQIVSGLKGYALEASDGRIGTAADFLFDDRTWKVRWLVVETGTWLNERKVLLHPSALGQVDHERKTIAAALTKTQIEASPSIFRDQPVSAQMESHLYDYYGWDPIWGGNYFGASPNVIASPFSPPPLFERSVAPPPSFPGTVEGRAGESGLARNDGDPDLRSTHTVTGYHIVSTDGEIGHLQDFLIDSETWGVRYLVIDTSNWWMGKHVLISPYSVKEINWADRQVHLDVTRERVKASPIWNPSEPTEQAYEKRLHGHYDWPGYGW
jgi:hypothetical protein